MLDFSLSDFIQERTETLPDNSLILISEKTFHISNDRIMFTPEFVAVNTDSGSYMIPNASIPIRKVENDQTMGEVLESVIVRRPNNNYINVNSISRSIAWWITNNAERLGYPNEVIMEYIGIDGEKRTILCERTRRKKWEIVAVYDPENEIITKTPEPAKDKTPAEVYADIMRRTNNENFQARVHAKPNPHFK